MWIKFIAAEIIELTVRKEALELVDLPWEDRQQISVKKRKNKPLKMKEFVTLLKGNLVKEREDLVSSE